MWKFHKNWTISLWVIETTKLYPLISVRTLVHRSVLFKMEFVISVFTVRKLYLVVCFLQNALIVQTPPLIKLKRMKDGQMELIGISKNQLLRGIFKFLGKWVFKKNLPFLNTKYSSCKFINICLNKNYSVSVLEYSDGYGNLQSDGNYTGMIGAVQRKESIETV